MVKVQNNKVATFIFVNKIFYRTPTDEKIFVTAIPVAVNISGSILV